MKQNGMTLALVFLVLCNSLAQTPTQQATSVMSGSNAPDGNAPFTPPASDQMATPPLHPDPGDTPLGIAAEEGTNDGIGAEVQQASPASASGTFSLETCVPLLGGPPMNSNDVERIKASAEKGNTAAQYNLGTCYANGNGVATNYEEAKKWYRRSAEQGLDLAQLALARAYYYGIGTATNYDEALKWLREAATNNDSGVAEFQLGVYYSETLPDKASSLAEALNWYGVAANRGFGPAQFRLAEMYEDGNGVPKKLDEAQNWYLRAMNWNGWRGAGPQECWVLYGQDYNWASDYQALLTGIQQNSFDELGAKATQGDVKSEVALAISYDRGYEVPQDFVKAAKWYQEAAEQGDSGAQYFLGELYAQGRGVPQNDVQAYVWLSLSAANGGTNGLPAAQDRDSVAQRMSREEIVEGQQQAAAFVSRKETPGPSSDGSGSAENPTATGTGFFITDDGYLISNYHVVKDAVKVRLRTSSGLIPAQVVQVDEADDIALLKADGNFSSLPIAGSRTVSLGATVATIGFPDPDLQGFAPKLAKGEIAALSGAQDDPRYFQISLPVQPGNSGGALVDEHGNVVGIVSAKLDAATALEASGALPEDVNYAIKSSFLLSFLESVPGTEANLKKPNLADANFEDVVKQAQAASALVVVY